MGSTYLREGLDLPEVSLVAILDADKEGFLRSERALVKLLVEQLEILMEESLCMQIK